MFCQVSKLLRIVGDAENSILSISKFLVMELRIPNKISLDTKCISRGAPLKGMNFIHSISVNVKKLLRVKIIKVLYDFRVNLIAFELRKLLS